MAQSDSPSDPLRILEPDRWVERHGDCLYRYALLRLRKADSAAEVVQDTFLAALRSRDHFTGRSSERTWLMGILKHKLLDYLRARKRPPADAGADTDADVLDEFFNARGLWKVKSTSWGSDPAQALENREFREVLEGCLQRLPGALAEAFFSREMDGLSSEEICTAMEISPTNLWARLHRARLLLRRCLELKWFGGTKNPT